MGSARNLNLSRFIVLGAVLANAPWALAQAPGQQPAPAQPPPAPAPAAPPAAKPMPATPPPVEPAPVPAQVQPQPPAQAAPLAPPPGAPEEKPPVLEEPPAPALPPAPEAPQGPISPADPLAPAAEEAPPGHTLIGESPGRRERPWYDRIAVRLYADAYANIDFNFPRGTVAGVHRTNPVRAYDRFNGFSLAWAGLDLEYAPEPVGGLVQLRFGPQAETLGAACSDGSCDAEYGLQYVKQAYVSWQPQCLDGALSLDLGKFDTPYGAEVADSVHNINYTRGVVYWLGQPAYHTGLRATAELSRSSVLRVLLVNGWNRSVDNNLGKTVGLQYTYRLPRLPDGEDDLLSLSLGYMVGPERDDFATVTCPPGQRFDIEANPATGCVPSAGSPGDVVLVDRGSANTKGLRHYFDLTLVATPSDDLLLALNGSLGLERQRRPDNLAAYESHEWYGVAAFARYAYAERAGIGGRFEYYGDPSGITSGFVGNSVSLVTGTVTLDWAPLPSVVFKLDGRVDWSDKEIFPVSVRDANVGTAVSATLGAVVATN